MAEENNEERRYREYVESMNLREILRIVDEKTGDTPCPFCGNPDWVIESDGPMTPAAVFLMKDTRSYFGPAPAVPVISLSCSECGFIRSHNVSLLKKQMPDG